MNDVLIEKDVLAKMADKYNEYSKIAAYWRRMDHPAWDKYATGAAAVLELIKKMFDTSKYTFVFASENFPGCHFEWRKVEVR